MLLRATGRIDSVRPDDGAGRTHKHGDDLEPAQVSGDFQAAPRPMMCSSAASITSDLGTRGEPTPGRLTNAVAKFAFSRGLPLWGNALASRGLVTFAGPIGWGATVVWGLHALAGPANKRIVDPGVDHIVWLRETKRHVGLETGA